MLALMVSPVSSARANFKGGVCNLCGDIPLCEHCAAHAQHPASLCDSKAGLYSVQGGCAEVMAVVGSVSEHVDCIPLEVVGIDQEKSTWGEQSAQIVLGAPRWTHHSETHHGWNNQVLPVLKW